MWGFMWGYVEKVSRNQKPCLISDEMLFLGRAINAVLLDGYIKFSSAARLTAARRLLTLSLL
jgi:hypothetical protein